MWLNQQRVLLLERHSDSALIVRAGQIKTVQGAELRALTTDAPPPVVEQPAAPKPERKSRMDRANPLGELRRMLIRSPGLARATAEQMGLDASIADEVVRELLEDFELPSTRASEKVMAYAEQEVIPRARLGQSSREIAKETNRDFKTVDHALEHWHFARHHEHLPAREVAFRLNVDFCDRKKLGYHQPRPTERSAEQVKRNHLRRLQGAAERRALNRRIDELLAQVAEAVKSRPVGGRRVTCSV